MNDNIYWDIYWDSHKGWYVCEYKDHTTGLPVIVNEESREAIVFILNTPPENGEVPETIIIKDDSDIPLDKDKDGEYKVTEVYLKCKKWGELRLPKTVKRIIIDRNPYKQEPSTNTYEYGTSNDSWFSIEDSDFLKSDYNGSVYSKDGKNLYHYCSLLYHYCSLDNNPLGEELEEILPGSIYNPEPLNILRIPCNVKKLSKGAISGSFSEIDFTGGLNEIESQAFNRIECDNIRINGLISDINVDGVKEMERHLSSFIGRRSERTGIFSLLAPEPQHGRLLNNGDIELMSCISLKDKISKHKDWEPLLIRSAIKNKFNECAEENISVHIESIKLTTNLYSEVDATKITVRCSTAKEPEGYIVHEHLKDVEELLKANTKFQVRTNSNGLHT